MANDLAQRMRLAAALGGKVGSGDVTPITGTLRRTTGTATADSSDGKVTVQLAGGDPIEVPTAAKVKQGDTVSLLVADGVATNATVAGWGDNIQEQADGLSMCMRKKDDGVYVGYSEDDGETFDTCCTRIDSDSFDILDKNKQVVASFGKRIINLLYKMFQIKVDGVLAQISGGTGAGSGDATASVNFSDYGISILNTSRSTSSRVAALESGVEINGPKITETVGSTSLVMDSDGILVNGELFTGAPTWTNCRNVDGKCYCKICVRNGTATISCVTGGGWWPITSWTNIAGSIFSDLNGDSTTGIPTAYRPNTRIYFAATNTNCQILHGYADVDGSIWVKSNGTSVSDWAFCASWPITW